MPGVLYNAVPSLLVGLRGQRQKHLFPRTHRVVSAYLEADLAGTGLFESVALHMPVEPCLRRDVPTEPFLLSRDCRAVPVEPCL